MKVFSNKLGRLWDTLHKVWAWWGGMQCLRPGAVCTTIHFLRNLHESNKLECCITQGWKGSPGKNILAFLDPFFGYKEIGVLLSPRLQVIRLGYNYFLTNALAYCRKFCKSGPGNNPSLRTLHHDISSVETQTKIESRIFFNVDFNRCTLH
jgi:hypothetical protein